MKKKGKVVLFLASLLLTACASADKAGLTFEADYQTFHYQGKDYAISQQVVDVEDVTGTTVNFMEFPLIDQDGHIIDSLHLDDKKVRESLQHVETTTQSLSLMNLYETRDKGLAIGINQDYYKVDLESNIDQAERIRYTGLIEKEEEE